MNDSSIEITLRIPGLWTSPGELIQRLPEGYQLSPDGMTLPDGQRIGFAPMQPDGQFAGIFESSCRRPPSREELDCVRRYSVNVCLFGPGGSLQAARTMMQAAAVIVRAGGAGVFIDNCGLAFGGKIWLELTQDGSPDALSFAFVSVVEGDDEFWTMGMHSLGFPEVKLPTGSHHADAEQVIDVLRYICESDRPVEVGHLLVLDKGVSLQVSKKSDCQLPKGSPMYNPLGCMTLQSGQAIAEMN